ncbi:keratin, type I cytoskeletal 18 [Gadus morhua]|uniref:IF rod domain-containing protein n=1 Tax=Gadus morhua TaxID=8049 RepID=A0A8C5CJ37_GADMO|nr:keratin-like protein KRT222 [Gadus morhua]XP_030207792.1 keratin-like protein KRT222 [Gadus morhua]
MDVMEDQRAEVRGLNARLKGFLEHMERLQDTNARLEGQIADWGARNGAVLRDWSQEESTVNGLRAQVGQLLVENAQLALQSDGMKSRAAAIQARCESEERQTQRLEQQVGQLRETRARAEESNGRLKADLWHSMTELEGMKEDYQARWSLQQQQQQQQWSSSCDALLASAAATTAAGQEEDGRGMELAQLLDRFRAQCGQLAPGAGAPGRAAFSTQAPGSAGPGGFGGARAAAAAASSSPLPLSSSSATAETNGGAFPEEEAAWVQVNLGGAALREARAELSEARKQWNTLQVEIQTLHALEKGLEGSLVHTQQLYSSQLQDLSQVIGRLEGELEQVRDGLAGQRQRHRVLLNTKMRLEHEITTYRRLLDREEGRYMVRNGQAVGLQPWRGPSAGPKENGHETEVSDPSLSDPSLSDLALSPDEPRSEPLPDIPPLLPPDHGRKRSSMLRRQQSLVVLTDPERGGELRIPMVKTQEFLQGNVVREGAEGHGTIETEQMDQAIRQWEGSFFKGNPKLRKKSVSLRFDLHMAANDQGGGQGGPDSLPDVEVRLVMKRSRSIPTIT